MRRDISAEAWMALCRKSMLLGFSLNTSNILLYLPSKLISNFNFFSACAKASEIYNIKILEKK